MEPKNLRKAPSKPKLAIGGKLGDGQESPELVSGNPTAHSRRQRASRDFSGATTPAEKEKVNRCLP